MYAKLWGHHQDSLRHGVNYIFYLRCRLLHCMACWMRNIFSVEILFNFYLHTRNNQYDTIINARYAQAEYADTGRHKK